MSQDRTAIQREVCAAMFQAGIIFSWFNISIKNKDMRRQKEDGSNSRRERS